MLIFQRPLHIYKAANPSSIPNNATNLPIDTDKDSAANRSGKFNPFLDTIIHHNTQVQILRIVRNVFVLVTPPEVSRGVIYFYLQLSDVLRLGNCSAIVSGRLSASIREPSS